MMCMNVGSAFFFVFVFVFFFALLCFVPRYDPALAARVLADPGDYLPDFRLALRTASIEAEPETESFTDSDFYVGFEGNLADNHTSPRGLGARMLRSLGTWRRKKKKRKKKKKKKKKKFCGAQKKKKKKKKKKPGLEYRGDPRRVVGCRD
jgi:hypothetical protein